MFGRTSDHAGVKIEPPPYSIEPGQTYSFQTRPYSDFGPANTHRFAAIKILGVSDSHVVVAVLDGVWPEVPTIKGIQATSILNEHRFAHTGRPAVFGVNSEWWKPESDLDKFSFAGTVRVSGEEHRHVHAVAGYRTEHSEIFAALPKLVADEQTAQAAFDGGDRAARPPSITPPWLGADADVAGGGADDVRDQRGKLGRG